VEATLPLLLNFGVWRSTKTCKFAENGYDDPLHIFPHHIYLISKTNASVAGMDWEQWFGGF